MKHENSEFQSGNLKGVINLGGVSIDGRIILK
jgi:hypothetical protein